MTDENEVPVIPMSIAAKIASLQTRKGELQTRLGFLIRDYNSARLDVDMGDRSAVARLAEINRQMIEVKGDLADVDGMLQAAKPREAVQREQARSASVADAWREVRANCDAAQREIAELVPQLRDCVRRLARINQFRAQAYGAVHQRLSADMQALHVPLPLFDDLAGLCRAAADESSGDGLKKVTEAWAASLLARSPVDLDEPRAA